MPGYNPCPLFIDEVQKENSVLEEINRQCYLYRNCISAAAISASALNRGVKTPKIYFRDTGLALLSYQMAHCRYAEKFSSCRKLFENFVVSEILKSYSNEGMDYRFIIFYYRDRDRSAFGENEIDLIIEENGILYPVEIKMSGNPKAAIGVTNQVLDKISDKKRGTGIILCLIDKKHIYGKN